MRFTVIISIMIYTHKFPSGDNITIFVPCIELLIFLKLEKYACIHPYTPYVDDIVTQTEKQYSFWEHGAARASS